MKAVALTVVGALFAALIQSSLAAEFTNLDFEGYLADPNHPLPFGEEDKIMPGWTWSNDPDTAFDGIGDCY